MENKKKLKREGFMSVYKEIADVIGDENTYDLFMVMKGQQITLPKRLYTTEFIISEIRKSDGNQDIRKIALEYDYTEKYIRQLLKGKISNDKEEGK